jgi:hypothetical protein
MAGLFQRIAQNYRKKKKITQPSARLNAKEDKTQHAGKVVRAKERIHSKVEKEDFLLSQIDEFREKAKQSLSSHLRPALRHLSQSHSSSQ